MGWFRLDKTVRSNHHIFSCHPVTVRYTCLLRYCKRFSCENRNDFCGQVLRCWNCPIQFSNRIHCARYVMPIQSHLAFLPPHRQTSSQVCNTLLFHRGRITQAFLRLINPVCLAIFFNAACLSAHLFHAYS